MDGKNPRCSRTFFFGVPNSSSYFILFLFPSPMFFIKNETCCLIQSPMHPLLWFVRVPAKHRQQPHTDLQLHNPSSHYCLFMVAPHNRCPRTTFLNQVRCFRSSFSFASSFLWLLVLFIYILSLSTSFIYVHSFETPT